MSVEALEIFATLHIVILVIFSFVYLMEMEGDISRWFLSVVLWGVFICAASIMIIFLHHRATKKIQEKTFTVYNIDGTQYIKDDDEIININSKFGKVFEETITLIRIDGNEKYWGVYPSSRAIGWELKEK